MSISVLMSVYKSEKPAFFDTSLQSIWTDQTLKPDEIILVEDGPLTEELMNVIEKWKSLIGDSLKIIVNKQNIGLTKSLNKGIDLAKGEYIARMDSDDISTPDRFREQLEYFEAHPDVAVVGGCIQEFSSSNDMVNIRRFPITNTDVKMTIHKASPLAHPTVMMRRAIFDDGLRYNEKYKTSQDLALWFDVLKAGYKIGNLSDITLKFRREENIYKRRSKAKAKNEFLIYVNGIYRIFGLFTFRYSYPLARYMFRMMPIGIIKRIYNSKLRKKILESKTSI